MEKTMELPSIKDMTNEEIKQELKDNGVVVHHKTGTEKLITTLNEVRTNTYKGNVKETTSDVSVGSTEASRAAKTKHVNAIDNPTAFQRAMKLTRVVVTPNDPTMVNYPGLIFTVGSSGINNGQMIKKFVPFNNEEGWHVPQIILEQIEQGLMQQFKTVVRANGEKVLEPYLTKKFNVRILNPLTQEEMQRVAASNKVAGFGIGATN